MIRGTGKNAGTFLFEDFEYVQLLQKINNSTLSESIWIFLSPCKSYRNCTNLTSVPAWSHLRSQCFLKQWDLKMKFQFNWIWNNYETFDSIWLTIIPHNFYSIKYYNTIFWLSLSSSKISSGYLSRPYVEPNVPKF